jgi:hypothetical protein
MQVADECPPPVERFKQRIVYRKSDTIRRYGEALGPHTAGLGSLPGSVKRPDEGHPCVSSREKTSPLNGDVITDFEAATAQVVHLHQLSVERSRAR